MISIFCNAPDTPFQKKLINTYEENLQRTIDYIKFHEGFSPMPVDDIGFLAAGFGCRLIYLPDTISFPLDSARSEFWLKYLFQENMRFVQYHYPELTENKLLAIAHLCYCCGIGQVLRRKPYSEGKLNQYKLYNFRYGIDHKEPFRTARIFEFELFHAPQYRIEYVSLQEYLQEKEFRSNQSKNFKDLKYKYYYLL